MSEKSACTYDRICFFCVHWCIILTANPADLLSPFNIMPTLSIAEYSNMLGKQGSKCGLGTSLLGLKFPPERRSNTNIMRLSKPKSS